MSNLRCRVYMRFLGIRKEFAGSVVSDNFDNLLKGAEELVIKALRKIKDCQELPYVFDLDFKDGADNE